MMMMICQQCDEPMQVQPQPHGPVSRIIACARCRAQYAVMVELLAASPLPEPVLQARRNRNR